MYVGKEEYEVYSELTALTKRSCIASTGYAKLVPESIKVRCADDALKPEVSMCSF
jgi:hypothetical protein